MKFKSEAHETLSVLFKRDGVSPKIVMDGSKELNLVKFHQKWNDACWYKHQTEPYSPWSNAAEGKMREIKKVSSWKMIETGTPKYLLDHHLELNDSIWTNAAIGYHIIDGKVPKMLMTRQAADISHICEYTWFDWEIFCDGPHVSYPENNLVLGQYLGPTLDVRPAMCAKILKNNSKVVPRSTLRTLTRKEIDISVQK